MCGINGAVSFRRAAQEGLQCIDALARLMRRRGPDDEGFWTDEQRCALGFRRLAILDLSPAGHQPMLTPDGRYVLVFNGEVYNFRELRRELAQEGARFRSTGDTEVVLQALAHWGKRALSRFNGMFALGLYDTQERCLLLARDYAGMKPLYYLHTDDGLVFASQYDQILIHPWRANLAVDAGALGFYLRLGYIPAPYALLEHTHMLEPGAWLEVTIDGNVQQGMFFAFPVLRVPDLQGEEAYEAVDAAVTAAVKRQLVSDVPVGTFLSGGIDSPLVAAKVQAAGETAVQAFTLGTNGDRFDESPDAVAYAQEMGLPHTVEHVTPDQALAMLDDVVSACGEPFADYSMFPSLLISRRARQEVKVMLSGDGGDELFWGYAERFGSVLSKARDFRHPHWLRSARWGAKKLFGIGNGYWNLRWPSIGDWYRGKHSHLPEVWLQRIFLDLPAWPADSGLFSYDGWEPDRTAQWLRWNEFVSHLTMVLLKVDRASMYHSLEVRVPLLDREVVEVASRIDWRSCLDVKNNVGKQPLRRALARHVQYQTQAKRGFTVPMNAWLRGALRPIFTERVLERDEILGLPVHRSVLAEWYDAHCSGKEDHAWGLWILLSLALWEDKHFKRARDVERPSPAI